MATKLKLGTDNNWATKKGNLLAYNDENGNFKPIPFDVTRASTATRLNKSGLIETVEQDRPRVEFDNNDGYVLLEPTRTNLCTYSEQLDAIQWYKYNSVSVEPNVITSPSGALTADKLISDGSQGLVMRRFGMTTLGVTHSFSMWAKKGNFNKLAIDIGDSGNQTFTLTDEWQRVSVTATPTSNTNIDVEMPSASNGDFIYLWGAQVEVGSYATSYIPTSGSAVTRTEDNVYNGGTDSVFNLTEGTLFFDVEVFRPINDSQRLISLSDGTSTNRILVIPKDTENTMRYFFSFNNITTETTPAFTYDTRQKIAIAYGGGNIKIYRNGSQQSSLTATTTFTDLDGINFSDVDNNPKATAKIYQTMYFNEKLTDAELIALTS